jgi:hypothetical protein
MRSVREPAVYRVSGTILVSIAAVVSVTGCGATVHSRWAKQRDSVDYWSPKLATIPINVHGTVPGSDSAETLARIPNGTNDDIYARKGETSALPLPFVMDHVWLPPRGMNFHRMRYLLRR